MRGEDLVDAEVVGLVGVALDHVGQVDGGALGGGAALIDPADALGGELFGGLDADVDAGERLAVHADQFGDAVKVNPGREGFHHLFAARGFEAEEGFAAVDALLEDVEAEFLPAGDVVDAEALDDAGAGFEEFHGGVAGVGRELLGEFEQALVEVPIDFGEGLGGFDEVGVAEASDLEGDLAGEAEVASALLGLDMVERGGAALEVDAGVDPGGVGDDAAEFEEGGAIAALELSEHGGRHAEAGAGQLVGVAGEGVDQLDEQAHLAQRQVGEHLRADVEVLRGKRAGFPGALVEGLALGGPIVGLGDGEVGKHLWAGTEERAGERGRGVHQADADIAPLAHAVVGDLFEHGRAAAEVLGGGFPRAEGVARNLQAGVDPVGELVALEDRLDRADGGLEFLAEGGREGAQRLARRIDRRLGGGSVGHRHPSRGWRAAAVRGGRRRSAQWRPRRRPYPAQHR